MRVLVADDDRVGATILAAALARWGFDVVSVCDGAEAWDVLLKDSPFGLAILDWEMPGADGLELCRRIRRNARRANLYVILLTARDTSADVVAGLDAGADDYLVKPFDLDELRARAQVGRRLVSLQERLADRVAELQDALKRVKQLNGLLPICAYCKRIRTDQDYWEQVEHYVADHSDAQFSHGICPTCFDTVSAEIDAVSSSALQNPLI
jgi:DNA-binding response OmpR family regulator